MRILKSLLKHKVLTPIGVVALISITISFHFDFEEIEFPSFVSIEITEDVEEAVPAPPSIVIKNEPVVNVVLPISTPSVIDSDSMVTAHPASVKAEVLSDASPDESPQVDLLAVEIEEQRVVQLINAIYASPVVELESIAYLNNDESTVLSPSNEDKIETIHTLTPGSIISATLLGSIGPDKRGIVVAGINRHVYDSRSFSKLLIPHGSRILGRYDPASLRSSQRVLVAWKRIYLPNGDTIDLNNAIGTDRYGNVGLEVQTQVFPGKAATKIINEGYQLIIKITESIDLPLYTI